MPDCGPLGTLQQMAGGYCVSRCLHAVVELGVADAIGEQPVDTGTLAEAVGANRDALGRILRLLAAHGVFALDHGRFSHTPASRQLREDHPQSMRALVRMFGLPLFWDAYGVFGHSVRTGQPSIELLQPDGLWNWFARNPEAAAVFDAAMAAKARVQVDAVLATYDFNRFGLVGDIGGGRGHLLRAVLEACPVAKGILFDLPHVIAGVASSPRMECRSGDFFDDALPSCDAYLLMEVLHDWDDDRGLALLKAIRRAAPPGATLLLIETLIPTTPGPDFARMLDVHMMALVGGRLRTADEYAYLLRNAGFGHSRTLETGDGVSIMEAIAC